MRRVLVALVLSAAAASVPGAAAGRGIGLSASPMRLTLKGASGAAITVRNPGRRPLLVDVSRAGFARSLRGKPRVRPPRGAAAWLRLRPKRLRIASHAKGVLHVRAVPPTAQRRETTPPTTRPLGVRHVRVRLRVGVVVVLHVRGRVVRRLVARALTVRRRGKLRLLELRLANRGNVAEELGRDGLRLSLARRGSVFATLRPRGGELLPHSAGIVVFRYRGPVRGSVLARIRVRRPLRGPVRRFHLRL